MERFLIQRAGIKKQLADFTLTPEIREGLLIKGTIYKISYQFLNILSTF